MGERCRFTTIFEEFGSDGLGFHGSGVRVSNAAGINYVIGGSVDNTLSKVSKLDRVTDVLIHIPRACSTNCQRDLAAYPH